jgi:hypothetical protein
MLKDELKKKSILKKDKKPNSSQHIKFMAQLWD